MASDREVDARVHLRKAENKVPQLRQALSNAQQAEIEANKAIQRHEQLNREVLVKMEQVSTEDPAAANQANRALIRSLDQQLTDANQQLRRLRKERSPNAADGQMAVHQSQTNGQLEALCAENEKLHKAIE